MRVSFQDGTVTVEGETVDEKGQVNTWLGVNAKNTILAVEASGGSMRLVTSAKAVKAVEAPPPAEEAPAKRSRKAKPARKGFAKAHARR